MGMKPFHFKQFTIQHNKSTFKVGTDGVLLGAWGSVEDAQTALDIGTGTGLIALMLAQRNSILNIEAIEISKEAAQLASSNVLASPWNDRVRVIQQNILDFATNVDKQYDCIVTNPPYFNAGTISPKRSKQGSRHTLSFSHDNLLKVVNQLLKPSGRFALILPAIEGQQFIYKAKKDELHLNRLTQVRSKKDKVVERFLMEFGKEPGKVTENELIIQYEERNHYTPEYIDLTKDFYLKM